MRIDRVAKEAVGRIVLWGPHGSGKTTTLMQLAREVSAEPPEPNPEGEYVPLTMEASHGYCLKMDVVEVPATACASKASMSYCSLPIRVRMPTLLH
jgi:hypothetical protein